jgi:peptide chain release factor 2
MAPPDGPAAGAQEPRDFSSELQALGERLAEAERYLGREKLEARRAELEKEVARPDLWDDADHARAVTKELGRVTADLEQLDGLAEVLGDARALLELTEESAVAGAPDAAFSAELVETVDALGSRLGALELQSLFSGEYDELDAVCEVHAGAGGTDAQDWTEMLLRMYQRWAERRGFTIEVDEATEGQEAGLLSATFIVHGRFAYGLLATERGVHRLVRMSPFDSQHRRQTSFASMDVTPFLEDVSSEVEIDEKDLRVDTYRSSGAGGQHVNKTDSAVRLTHLPTGLVVSVQNERSQHQNKAKALQILGAKLADRARAARQAELDALSGERVDNAWGNQIRSYVLAPYQLVKDLRTGYETGNVDAVLDGDLDEFMEAELRRQREVSARGTTSGSSGSGSGARAAGS